VEQTSAAVKSIRKEINFILGDVQKGYSKKKNREKN
jgi:hypothetical protein